MHRLIPFSLCCFAMPVHSVECFRTAQDTLKLSFTALNWFTIIFTDNTVLRHKRLFLKPYRPHTPQSSPCRGSGVAAPYRWSCSFSVFHQSVCRRVARCIYGNDDISKKTCWMIFVEVRIWERSSWCFYLLSCCRATWLKQLNHHSLQNTHIASQLQSQCRAWMLTSIHFHCQQQWAISIMKTYFFHLLRAEPMQRNSDGVMISMCVILART